MEVFYKYGTSCFCICGKNISFAADLLSPERESGLFTGKRTFTDVILGASIFANGINSREIRQQECPRVTYQ